MTRLDRTLALLGLAVLLVLHVDFWRAPDPRLLLGVLPVELAYRFGWLALAWAYLWFFCRRVWRDTHDEAPR